MNLFRQIDEDITLLLDNLPMGIVRLNSNKKCIYANKFMYNILDVTTCEEINHTLKVCIHEDDRETENKHCNDFLINLIESESIFRLYNKIKKEYRWMTNKRTIIRPFDINNSFSFMYTLQDIHENKMMEINLRNETIKAEEAYNHKSIFLANMSHEVRTPLNGIIGMLTLLEDTSLNSEQQDYISMIKECSFNLMTIINDILDYSKLEVGKISLDLKPMNLRECIESTNDIVLSKIYEKSLEYTYNIQSEIPTFIKIDSNRIKQVLLNLLSNSIKFTDKGNIFLNIELINETEYNLLYDLHHNSNDQSQTNICTLDNSSISLHSSNSVISSSSSILSSSLISCSSSSNSFNLSKCDCSINCTCNKKYSYIHLRIDVTDTGCGIDTNDYNKLFKSFSQVDNRLTSKIYQGTGLGLAISQELIELMNGCIWLDWSEVSKGSRFSFIIKTEICEDNSFRYEENEQDILLLKNKNVLILDDNVYNRISVAGMVSKWGMKAYSFSNTEEALYFSKITSFDIGLIDVCMPKIDGPTFASKLRDQDEFNNKTFPLIALSSIGDKISFVSKYFKTNLMKPIKENKLKHICIDALKYHSNSNNLDKQAESQNDIISTNHVTSKSLDSYIKHNDLKELKDNVRILLAEDIYINQKVITSFLNKMGFYNIQVVENGQQCLNLIHQSDFEIVLLDIRMPIMNGEIALQNMLKFYEENQNKTKPYIVAVTAYCLKEDKDKYMKMGFDDYIPKPVSYSQLLQCTNNFIQTLLTD